MKTKRYRSAALVASLAVLLGITGTGAATVVAAEPQAAKPNYTRPEYDAYQAAAAEKNPQQKIKLLDDFVSKYPTSDLLYYAYKDYIGAYLDLKQWGKYIEYLDKFAALPAAPVGERVQALYQRAASFEYAYNAKSPDLAVQAAKGRDAALQGLKLFSEFQKPPQATDEQWAAAKKQYTTQFDNTAGICSLYLKDYKAAADNFRASLAENADQPGIYYSLSKAYFLQEPPQFVDGLWAVARALDEKLPDPDGAVTKFLHSKIYDYELPGCEAQVDSQIKELLTLAQNSKTPPAGYTIPSAADLNKVRQESTIQTVLADLRAGGDKAKLTWLAVCSGGFDEALAKAYEVNAATPDAIVIKAAIGITEEELKASTAANGDLKIAGQPEAARLEKDAIFRFGGKLTGYTPEPFYLTWENVKVNPEDIPEEKGKKPAKRPGKAKP
jgi:hypothetical protein